jgi:hypothetical protein
MGLENPAFRETRHLDRIALIGRFDQPAAQNRDCRAITIEIVNVPGFLE